MIDSAPALVRPSTPSRALAWLHAGDRPMLLALLVCQAAPLCLFAYFPTRDGPTHLEGALLLLRLSQPSGSALRQWFTLTLSIAPNWLDHVVLAALAQAVPPVLAEKLLVAAFVLGLPLAARRALAAIRPDARFLAVLTLPFTYSWLLHMGFYNFCLSLPLFFLALASWLRDRVSTGGALLRLAGWTTLLYFTHPVALAAAAALLLALAAWSGVVDLFEARRLGLSTAYAGRQACRRLVRTGLAFLPAALLFAGWFAGRRNPAFERAPLGPLLRDLVRLDVLVTFDPLERMVAAALSLVFAGLLLAGLARRVRVKRPLDGDAWLMGGLGFVLAYLVAPFGLAGGGYLTPRLAILPFFALLLWLGTLRWGAIARIVVAVAAAAITLAMLALHARAYRDANDLLAEYLSVEPWLDADTTVLPLHYRNDPEPRVDVMAHAAAYLAISRGTVDLVFYEGSAQGIFPVAFYREVSPYRLLGDNPESVPPCVDLPGFMERTGRTIDTVLTWKRLRARSEGRAVSVHEQLLGAYELVHVSQPQQLLEVWRRKEIP
jgi:hypothetical protein